MPRTPVDAPLERRTTSKRTGEPLRRMTAYKLPPDLVDTAKDYAAAEGTTMTSIVEAALERYVKAAARRQRATLNAKDV